MTWHFHATIYILAGVLTFVMALIGGWKYKNWWEPYLTIIIWPIIIALSIIIKLKKKPSSAESEGRPQNSNNQSLYNLRRQNGKYN